MSDEYSAGILLYCPEDKTIFLIRRSKHMNNPHQWDLPGGRNNKEDLNPKATAEREATEEVGSLPKPITYIGKHILDSSFHAFAYSISKEIKDKWHPHLDKESDTFGWFKLTELPKDTHSHIAWIEDFVKRSDNNKSAIIKTASIIAPRFEYKYIVSPTEADYIKEYIKPFVTADTHGQFYNIKNIYFDNEELQLYNNHALLNDRFKLRIRYYDTNEDPYYEIKRRANKNIIKHRYNSAEENMFSKLVKITNAFPVMLINYDREAYEGEGRITFDSNLKYASTESSGRNQEANGSILPKDFHILELKFNGQMPSYMKDLVIAFDLKRVPMSKYYCAVSNMLYG